MKFGVVLQTTPPSARVVDLAKRAETYGFSTCGRSTPTSCGRSRTSSTARSSPRPATSIVGPMVTNPATRDWTVTASLFATLNEMYGNRTVCGIGRGDSAVRVTNGKPTTLATLREAMHVIRELANGRSVDYKGSTLRFPWADRSRLEVWVAGYGPQGAGAHRRGRRRVHPAARRPADHRLDDRRRARRRRAAAGRDPDDGHDLRRRAGLRQRRPRPRARPVPLVRRDGRQPRRRHRRPLRRVGGDDRRPCRRAHRLHRGPPGLRLQRARPGRQHPHRPSCPTRSSTASACSARSSEQIRRLEELRELGVDQFAIYLQHDAKDATLARPTASRSSR